jgi:predicted AAA+ superfamily ATPase
MKHLVELSERLIESVSLNIVRDQIKWLTKPDRLIGIKGARGAGKSTLLLQFARMHSNSRKRLYVSLDDILFSDKKITELAVAR